MRKIDWDKIKTRLDALLVIKLELRKELFHLCSMNFYISCCFGLDS